MDFLNQLFAFVQQHQQLLLVGIGVYLVATGRIDISALLKIFQPAPAPGPVPTPAPGPDLLALIQSILQMLQHAKASGDTEKEKAALVLLSHVAGKE